MADVNAQVQAYLEAGFSLEEAKKMAGMVDNGEGNSLPFSVIKINYDKDDILIEHTNPVKKGSIITDFEIDKQNLVVKTEGKVFEQPMEFVIFGVFYQYSRYDTATGSYGNITPLYRSMTECKKTSAIDMKTGKTVQELIDSGYSMKFNQILGILVKEGTEWKPYLMYLRGVNYFEFWKQLQQYGVDNPSKAHLQRIIKVKTKKISTEGGLTAWIYNVVEVTPLQPADLAQFREVLTPAINKLDDWVTAYANGNTNAKGVSEAPAPADTENPADAPADDNIDWDDQ